MDSFDYEITIVMPVYNEPMVANVVDEWANMLKHCCGGNGYRMILVDDGCNPSTKQVLGELQKRPYVKVLHQENKGHGAAIWAGYNYASNFNTKWVFQIDSDGQVSARDFPKFWCIAVTNHDMHAVLGYRTDRKDGAGRLISTLVLRTVFYAHTRQWCDSNVPFRLIKADTLKHARLDMQKVLENKHISAFDYTNIILTQWLVKNELSHIMWQPISFVQRKAGKNTVSMTNMPKRGIQAIKEMRIFSAFYKQKQVPLVADSKANSEKIGAKMAKL